MRVHLSQLSATETEEDSFWDRDPSTWGSGWGASDFDPEKCSPNESYPKNHPCELVQKGVDIGQVLILNRRAQQSGGAGGSGQAGQWISGIPNTAVLLGGAMVAFLLFRR